MASTLGGCSDGLEIVCWNGEKVRIAFIIDAFDREIIAHVAVAGAGISGSDVRDMMLAAVERRSEATAIRIRLSTFPTTAGAHTAKGSPNFARALGLVPCLTPDHPKATG